jgi:hypothetical protein
MGTWVVNFTHIGNMLLVDWRECLCFRVICVLLRVVIKFFELGETKYTTLSCPLPISRSFFEAPHTLFHSLCMHHEMRCSPLGAPSLLSK